MKVGDSVAVTIAGQVVANATVKEMADGTATLIVPATRVVMAVRTELAYEAPVVQEQTTETIITGVDRPEAVEAASVVQNVETANSEVATTDVATVTEETTTVESTVSSAAPSIEAAVQNQLPEQVVSESNTSE